MRRLPPGGPAGKENYERKRHIQVAVLTLTAIAPLAAQVSKGWKMRVDHSTSASDPDQSGSIRFITMGSGTFTLMKPSGRTNCDGLGFGCNDLDGPQQSYVRFMGTEWGLAYQAPQRRRGYR